MPANVFQAWKRFIKTEILVVARDALLGDPFGTAEHSYQFSQPPWSLPELCLPSFSGKPFPTHQRWASGLAGADRVWVPSLYVGLMTVLLGVLGFRLWGRKPSQVWLTYVFLFFMLALLVGMDLSGWLSKFIRPIGINTQLGPQVGGLYWWMNMLLPKYFAFRYPAKLFVVASLALSVLAGVNFRGVRSIPAIWLSLVFIGLTGAGIGVFIACCFRFG